MPLDASLNNDVHTCVDMHVAFTHHLKPGDLGYEKRFSRHTPAEQTSAYLRLLDPDLGLEAGRRSAIGSAIRDHRGVTVPDLGTRKGHRALAAQGKAQRGGKREKGAPSGDIWVHPDAAQARLGLNAASLERHKKSTT